MEQLTTLDAGFLEAEDSDRHVSLAIGGLAVVDGPAPDYDMLVATLGERVPSIPRFTQVLHTHLFDLSAPEWVDDARFDSAHHVHRRALSQPGDDAALFRLVAEIMERRLDRDRPLWECWIIEGLAEGRWAMLTKLHHCIADGISATHVLTGICDGTDGSTFADRIRGAKESKPQAIRPSRLGLNPLNWIGGMWRLSTAVTSAAARATMGAVEIAAAVVTPADSLLTGPVSNLRRYSSARVSLTRRWDTAKENHTVLPRCFLVAVNTGANSCATPIAATPDRPVPACRARYGRITSILRSFLPNRTTAILLSEPKRSTA